MILSIISHDLFIRSVGAILTGIIIPLITRNWQNHQKELDLKTGLVAEMVLARKNKTRKI